MDYGSMLNLSGIPVLRQERRLSMDISRGPETETEN